MLHCISKWSTPLRLSVLLMVNKIIGLGLFVFFLMMIMEFLCLFIYIEIWGWTFWVGPSSLLEEQSGLEQKTKQKQKQQQQKGPGVEPRTVSLWGNSANVYTPMPPLSCTTSTDALRYCMIEQKLHFLVHSKGSDLSLDVQSGADTLHKGGDNYQCGGLGVSRC